MEGGCVVLGWGFGEMAAYCFVVALILLFVSFGLVLPVSTVTEFHWIRSDTRHSEHEHECFDAYFTYHMIMSKMIIEIMIAHRLRFLESAYIPCVMDRYIARVLLFTAAPSRSRT